MNHIVLCTFDLRNANRDDFSYAYAELARIGLIRVHKTGNGRHVVIPSTAVMGQFRGATSETVVRHVEEKVKVAFSNQKFQAEFFIVAGAEWAWSSVIAI